MGIINYEELEEPIKQIELMLEPFDMEEKALVLRIINGRFQKGIQQRKIKENLQDTMPKWVMKMINRKSAEEEDGKGEN